MAVAVGGADGSSGVRGSCGSVKSLVLVGVDILFLCLCDTSCARLGLLTAAAVLYGVLQTLCSGVATCLSSALELLSLERLELLWTRRCRAVVISWISLAGRGSSDTLFGCRNVS
jgi:hypothetical protein